MIFSGEAKLGNYLKKSDEWFKGKEASEIAQNIISYQSKEGGWPKNQSTTDTLYKGDREKLKATYDNRATTNELRFIARIYGGTKKVVYRESFVRGLDYILKGQYQNGGWPQYYPPGSNYHRRITFNDNAMVRLLNFIREVATDDQYDFVDKNRRRVAAAAFERGIECILKCQIQMNGQLTVWCAQHDEVNLKPQSARSYELASFSGAESVGITRLLMSLDKPSPEVVESIEAAVAWFRSVKIAGIRVDQVKDQQAPKGINKVVVKDFSAAPIWARFYDLESSRPIFVDRDGLPKSTLAEIGYERRNGYAWYGKWPQKLLETDYVEWLKKLKH